MECVTIYSRSVLRAIIAAVDACKQAVCSSTLMMHKSSTAAAVSAAGSHRRRTAGQPGDEPWSSSEFPTNFSAIVADDPPLPLPCLTRPVGTVPPTHRQITPAKVRPACYHHHQGLETREHSSSFY